MSLWKIAWRSLQQRPLTSTLTCLSMALGVALVVAVITIYAVVEESFARNRSLGYHLIVGGKNGSKLELVMSTVFHLGRPEVPVPYKFYKEFISTTDDKGKTVVGKRSQYVKRAVPICLGDNYQGYRVVATLPTIFDFQYARNSTYKFAEGENFALGKEGWFQAVVGAEVARRSGLGMGSTFRASHGVADSGENATVHKDAFHVVGVLAPTGTPNDRALFVHMEGFYRMEGHGKDPKKKAGAEAEVPESDKEVTAILVEYTAGFALPGYEESMAATVAETERNEIDRSTEAQAAQPVRYVTEVLNRFVAPTMYILMGITILTVIVASIGVMVGIYNTMIGRRHEIAVMRALGAGRTAVMLIVLLESILLSLAGGAAGFVLGHVIVAAAGPMLVDYTGVTVGLLTFDWRSLIVVPGLVVLASVVGYLPALAAYKTDVVKGLTATG